jgi:hypothetical protein
MLRCALSDNPPHSGRNQPPSALARIRQAALAPLYPETEWSHQAVVCCTRPVSVKFRGAGLREHDVSFAAKLLSCATQREVNNGSFFIQKNFRHFHAYEAPRFGLPNCHSQFTGSPYRLMYCLGKRLMFALLNIIRAALL